MAKAEQYPNVGALTGDKKVLAVAVERFKQCLNSSDIIRAEALEDVMFVNGKQWLESILKDRADDRRPALTINRLPTFINQVANDLKTNRPSIKIRPTNNQWKPTADVIDGLIRNIVHQSDSAAAIDTASQYQVMAGMGYIRVLTDYVDDGSFDNQEIKIGRIENPFSVYFPLHLTTELDFSDAPYCFIRSKMSKEDFAAKYPDSYTSNFESQGAGDPNWQGPDYIYVAEYFEVETEEKTLYLLKDGTITMDKPVASKIVKERSTTVRKVTWRLLTEFDVLDKKEWLGKYIPIIPVLGLEINENGKKTYISLTRWAKDAQRMFNYMYTAFAEQIALAPKAPFIVAEGQVDNYKMLWQTANLKNHAYLPYTPTSLDGVPVPPPQRVMPPEAGIAIVQGIEMASDNLKAVTGIFDASLGAKGNETSGRAIIARQREGASGNLHFAENLARAVRHIGRIIVDLIPKIYDAPRTIRILGDDMIDKVVDINQTHPNEKGEIYDMTAGKYDIVVDVGPSYETKRIETAQNLISIAQAVPQLAMALGDVLLRQLDFPLSGEAADRIKRLIQSTMPGIIEEETTPGGKLSDGEIRQIVQDLQKLQQEHNQSLMQVQQLSQIISRLNAQLQDKDAERQNKVTLAQIRAQAEMGKAQLEHEHAVIEHAVDAGIQQQTQAQQERMRNIMQPPTEETSVGA